MEQRVLFEAYSPQNIKELCLFNNFCKHLDSG